MKIKTMVCAPIATLILNGSLIGEAQATTTIILDTFTRSGVLNGSATDTGQVWDTFSGTSNSTDGSTAQLSGSNVNRIAGLSFATNTTYTLSMDVGLNNATLEWTGFGFGNLHTDSIGFMLFKPTPEAQFFTSDLTSQQTEALADRSSRLFEIILQTGSTLGNSTLSWAIDGSSVGSSASVSAVGINSVFLQASGSESTVDNFRLTSVPEPSSVLLLGVGSLGLMLRRSRR